jgi:GNAT superfamily N-acetyltransferase
MTSIRLVTGADVADCLDGLATLRLEIFREFPYLYAGDSEDERAYLKRYAEAPDACVAMAEQGGEIIGAGTGIPLCAEDSRMRAGFAGGGPDIADIFYIGELLLYPGYRNSRFGSRLFGLLEGHARSLGPYRRLGCATVVRPDDHPLRPSDYLPIERFLERHRFSPVPGHPSSLAWRETDGVVREHPMRCWIRNSD